MTAAAALCGRHDRTLSCQIVEIGIAALADIGQSAPLAVRQLREARFEGSMKHAVIEMSAASGGDEEKR